MEWFSLMKFCSPVLSSLSISRPLSTILLAMSGSDGASSHDVRCSWQAEFDAVGVNMIYVNLYMIHIEWILGITYNGLNFLRCHTNFRVAIDCKPTKGTISKLEGNLRRRLDPLLLLDIDRDPDVEIGVIIWGQFRITTTESNGIALFTELGSHCRTNVGTCAEDKGNEFRRQDHLFDLKGMRETSEWYSIASICFLYILGVVWLFAWNPWWLSGKRKCHESSRLSHQMSACSRRDWSSPQTCYSPCQIPRKRGWYLPNKSMNRSRLN